MKKVGGIFPSCLAIVCLLMSGCTSNTSLPQRWHSQEAALPLMEYIALKANRCWFKSGNGAFKPYRLAPELHSFSDRPRILLVPYAQPTARPLLVIEASGNPAQMSAYGPLLATKMGKNILHDLKHWLGRPAQC